MKIKLSALFLCQGACLCCRKMHLIILILSPVNDCLTFLNRAEWILPFFFLDICRQLGLIKKSQRQKKVKYNLKLLFSSIPSLYISIVKDCKANLSLIAEKKNTTKRNQGQKIKLCILCINSSLWTKWPVKFCRRSKIRPKPFERSLSE